MVIALLSTPVCRSAHAMQGAARLAATLPCSNWCAIDANASTLLRTTSRKTPASAPELWIHTLLPFYLLYLIDPELRVAPT